MFANRFSIKFVCFFFLLAVFLCLVWFVQRLSTTCKVQRLWEVFFWLACKTFLCFAKPSCRLMSSLSSSASSSSKSKSTKAQSKSLGSWFPTATTRKVPLLTSDQKCSILLFYHYVRPLQMSTTRTEQLKIFLDHLTHTLQIGGRIRYAQEGLNCTVSGTRENLRQFASRLSSPAPSGFGIEFKDTDL